MTVVSISLNETLLEKLEEIEEEQGFSGRSEVIRTAVRNFIDERKNLDELEGEASAVMTVNYEHDTGLETHQFQELIKSQLHSHDTEGDCLQVFILEGPLEQIVDMKQELEAERNVTGVNLSI